MSAPPPPSFAQQPLPPLPPGWTEHRAPAGQPYWFNPATNVSTYIRPTLPPPPPPGFHHPPSQPPQPLQPIHYAPGQAPPTIAPAPAAAKKEKREKPKDKTPIPGTDWIKVVTNKGNTFYTNKETKQSLWSVPDEIKDQVDQMDKEANEAAAAAAAAANGRRKRKADEVDAEAEAPAAEENIAEEKEDTPEEEPEAVKDVPEASASPAPAPEPAPVAATEPEPEPAPPKPKKAKRKVVTEIEELEQDDDWQRRIAEEMAKEVEEQEKATMVQDEPPAKAAEAAVPSPANGGANKFEGTPEEAAALFKAMLSEKDIQPMAPWDMELPKFVNDPRYTAVRQLKDRRDLFDEFCKIKIREQRAAKKAALEGGVKVDPVVAYRALLAAEVTSTRTHFSDFKRAHAKDPRFREFGKTEGEKEKVFRAWLRGLGERKRAEAEKAEKRFVEMLGEDKEIKTGNKWADVKARHAKDRRYEAVNSSSLRESLFNKHLASLAHGAPPTASTSASTSVSQPPAPSKADRAARAAAALREREDQIRHEQARAQRSAQAARGAAGREEAEREFGQLLIDHVRDHDARLEDVMDELRRDPRFEHPALQPHDHRRLFDEHLRTLYTKRLAQLEGVFLQHAPLLTTPFSQIEEVVLEAPQAQRLVGTDARRLEALYDSWLARRTAKAKDEFQELLKENSVLEHWGRLQKKEGQQEGAIEVKDEDEEEGEDAPDLREMAGQVDVRAIEQVLKHDKRYLMWAHEPEMRTRWVEDYLARLAPPKQTVHQKE